MYKDAVLNINKPVGWTSFDVVRKVRSLFKIPKVGHAGTLDPFATGVLLILTGNYTKRAPEFFDLEKEYVGEMELGVLTDTLDITGKIIQKKAIVGITSKKILDTCEQFIGEIEQIPPMYSAVKIGGKRLYKLARAGKVVPRKPKRVKIYQLEVLKIKLPLVKIRVVCSKGTYIRALTRDIGEQLGCGAYLRSLTRTRVGNFKLEEALNMEDLVQMGTADGDLLSHR